MDEAELEDWFNEEREKLEATFFDQLMKNKGTERAKERFDKQYRNLIHEYQKKENALYVHEQRVERIQKPIAKIRIRFNKWKKLSKKWVLQKKKEIEKWFFDRKIRHILRTR